MENINLSQANQAYIAKQKAPAAAKEENNILKPEKKFNKKKILLTLGILSTAAIAGIAIYKGKNSKAGNEINNLLNNNPEIKEKAANLLKDINFNKGEAILKETNEKFTGIVEDILKNGDKITLEYKDGILQKSTRKGSIDLEKIYEKIDEGKMLTKIVNGEKQTPIILKDLTQEVKNSQEKLQNILKNKENLTLAEFQEQIESVEYISKKQHEEINEIIKNKKDAILKQAENKTKIKQEKEAKADLARKNLKKAEEEFEIAKQNRYKNDESELEYHKKQIAKIEAKIEDLKINSPIEYEFEKQELEKSLIYEKNILLRRQKYFQTMKIDMSKNYLSESEEKYYGAKYSNIKAKRPEIYETLTKNSKEFEFYTQNKDLDLSSDVNLFEDFNQKTYDIPERFAIMADNSLRKNGNAYIFENTPKVFEGLNPQEVSDEISKFARFQGDNKYYQFKIAGKNFKAEAIGAGEVGKVYKISDELGNQCAIKIYSSGRGKSLDLNCGLSEIATSRQLAKDNVGDVPKFYMANAGLYKFGKNNEIYNDNPWMICDFIEENTTPKANTQKLNDWLKCHHMHYGDGLKNIRTKGGILIDVGGIVSDNYKERLTWGEYGLQGNNKGLDLSTLLEWALKEGMGIKEILQLFH